MDRGSSPQPAPDLIRQASGAAAERLAIVVLIVGLVICAGLFVLLARVLDGVVRVVVLGALAPVVLIAALIVWRGIRTVQSLARRREQTHAELRARRVIGVLAYPTIPGWNERLQRDFVLPALPHLLVASPETIDTERGQHAMTALGDLIGRPPPPDGMYTLAGRATLALIDDGINPDGTTSIWDLSTMIERVDAGDAAAGEELYEIQLYLQQRAMDAMSPPRP